MTDSWDTWNVPERLRSRMLLAAHEQRRQPTRSEALLWQALRRKGAGGVKFRRQQPIGPFIVDFFAPAVRLVVEVDGPVHDSQTQADQERQALLESLGFQFLRLSSETVERELPTALAAIEAEVAALRRPSPPDPLPHKGGRGSTTSIVLTTSPPSNGRPSSSLLPAEERPRETRQPRPSTGQLPSSLVGEGPGERGQPHPTNDELPSPPRGRGAGGEGAPSLLRKLLLTLLVLGGLSLYVAAGTYALFSAQTTNPSNTFQAGTVKMASNGAGLSLFTVPALLPGQSVDQPVEVQNTGTLPFRYSMLVTAPTSSALDQDAVNGLQLQVNRCLTGPWVVPGDGTPTPTAGKYVCSAGTSTPVATQVAYSGPALNLLATPGATPVAAPVPISTALAGGATDHLNIVASLPLTALQLTPGVTGLKSTLDVKWQAEAAATLPALPVGTPVGAPAPTATAASVTGLSVTASPSNAGVTAVHSFTFTTGSALTEGDSVIVEYPATPAVGNLSTLSNTRVAVRSNAGARFVSLPASPTVTVSGNVITIPWSSSIAAQPGDQVTIQLNGLTNPSPGMITGLTLKTNRQAAAASANLTITQSTGSLSVASATGAYLGATTLTATLSPAVANKPITFSVAGVQINPDTPAMTNASGVATLSYTISNLTGTYPVGASFAGDADISNASGTGTLTVTSQ